MNKTILIVIIIIILAVGSIFFLRQSNKAEQLLNNKISNNQENFNIVISNFSFNPGTITAKVGETITWINQDSVPHKIKSDTFNSEILNPGDSFQNTFNTPGTYDYICSIHPSMKGKIIVQ